MNKLLNRLSYFFLFLFLFLPIYTLYGQAYIFDAQLLKKEDGLANLMTTSVLEDQDGYLWISTAYGLNRYDGYHLTLYTKEKNGLHTNNKIFKLLEDEQGNIWLFHHKKVNANFLAGDYIEAIDIFNPKTEQVISFDSLFGDKAPFNFEDLLVLKSVDAQNRLWLATEDGAIYLFQSGEFTKIYEQPETLFEYITVVENDEIWLGWDEQLIKINFKGKVIEKHSLPETLMGVWIGENRQLWLATSSKKRSKNFKEKDIVKYNLWSKSVDGEITPFLLKKGGKPFDMAVNPSLFIHRTRNGLWHFKKKHELLVFDEHGDFVHNFNELASLNSDSQPVVFEPSSYFESTDFLWLTSPTGLWKTKSREKPFRIIHQKEGYSDCRGITEDNEGNIYFLNHWLYKWHPQQQKAPEKLLIPGSFALTYLDSSMWAGAYHNDCLGIEINPKTHEIINYNKPNVKLAYTTLRTNSAEKLLLGTVNGLQYANLQDKALVPFTKYNEFEILKNTEVHFLYRNKNGIWMATNRGVFLMNEEEGVIKMYNKASNDLPFDFIRHIHEAEDGVFWLATKGGGIIRWQPSLVAGKTSIYEQFTTEDGLSNNYTYAIYGDNYGKLWIPSDMGLMYMDKTSREVGVFLEENGLPHNEFNSTAHFQAKDSTLYFGGLGGLISFHPKTMGDRFTNKEPLKFTRYHVLEGDKEAVTDKTALLTTTDEIIIEPTDKFFELAFALLDYDDPSQHSYAYQIEGYSNRWNYIEENYVRIPSLPYGDYRLKVRGRSYGKDWSAQILSLDVKVKKPFYLETWFIFMISIGLIGTIAGLVDWRIRNLKEEQERLEAEVQKRTKTIQLQAEELQMLDKAKTRFFSNITHEFRTPLTLVIGPLEQVMEMELPAKSKSKLGSVLGNAKHLLGLINQLLDIAKLEDGQMQIERMHGDIIAYTKELVQRIKPLAEKKQQTLSFITQKAIWKTHFDKKNGIKLFTI